MSEKLKIYTPREELLSAYSHLAGVFLACIGAVPLYQTAVAKNDLLFSIGLGFYWISLLAMFSASSIYHFFQDKWKKVLARKFDHCAIYLLITGTYAPLITGAVRNKAGYIILLSLGILTLIGIAGKIFFANKFHYLEVIIYIAMGWACVFIARDLLNNLSGKGLLLLLYGGIAYTGGVVFYVIRKEFFHALWHIFVLTGAIFQFFAVLSI